MNAVTNRSPATLQPTLADPDALRKMVKDLVGSDGPSIEPATKTPLSASFAGAALGDAAVFHVACGSARVHGEFDPPVYAIHFPIGRPFRGGRASREYDTNVALALNPGEQLDLTLSEGGSVLVVAAPRRALASRAASTRGRIGREQLCIPETLSVDSGTGGALRRYVTFLWSEARSGSTLFEDKAIAEEFERSLLSLIVHASYEQEQRSNTYCDRSGTPEALDYIMANLSEPLSVASISAACGTHARTLNREFRAQYGLSIMAYVRRERLNRAREQLLAADPDGTTVSSVALESGFGHLGRFAIEYRRVFGERPSETLGRLRVSRRRLASVGSNSEPITHGQAKTVGPSAMSPAVASIR